MMRTSFASHGQVKRVGSMWPQDEWIITGVNGHMLVQPTCSSTNPFVVNPCDANGNILGCDEPVSPQSVDDAIRYALSMVGGPA